MSNQSKVKSLILCCTIIIGIIISGCSAGADTSTTPSSPSTIIVNTNQASIPTISHAVSLNPKGPWLIYPTTQGIKAANADGSGSRSISSTSITDLVASEPDIPSGISPTGRLIAHRKNNPGGKGWELEIIHLPDLTKETITPLISANNLARMESGTGEEILLTSSVVFESPVQWSPDGRYLAFVAALDGPSSDLYIYDTVAKKITHATSGELEVARPTWLPDGSGIIYQVVTTFGTGAGWATNGVRVVKPDGSGDRLIYRQPNGTGPETILEISRNNIALVDHFDPGGGGLYLVNLNTGELHLLTAEYSSADMDPVNGGYVFIDGQGRLNFAPTAGTFFQPVSDLLFTNGRVYWDMHFVYFIIQAEAVVGIDPFGDFVEFRGVPFLAYDNDSRCTATYGIECDTPGGIFTIPDAHGAVVYWVPDTSGFFYTLNNDLYYVSIANKTPIQIDSDLLPPNPLDYRMVERNVAWME